MQQVNRNLICRVGVDLAKRVCQVHAVDDFERVVMALCMTPDRIFDWCQSLQPGCVVAMESCSGAHHICRRLRPHLHTVPVKSAKQFGGWAGLAPSHNSSCGKTKVGGITKRGDVYLRTLLIQNAKSAVMTGHKRNDPISLWLVQLKESVGWQKAITADA